MFGVIVIMLAFLPLIFVIGYPVYLENKASKCRIACKNCKFCEETTEVFDSGDKIINDGNCLHSSNLTFDRVTGKYNPVKKCSQLRNESIWSYSCGPDASWFKQKEQEKVKEKQNNS